MITTCVLTMEGAVMANAMPVNDPGPINNPANAPALVNNPAPNHQGIVDKLRKMFDELVEVKVITAVGGVNITLPVGGSGAATIDTGTDALHDALVTIVNLVDGDVTSVIAPTLKDDAELRAFHLTQVDKSMAVLPTNITALVGFGKALLNDFNA
jgi:hypothetical protein